jgi:hypothetical protein
MHKAKDNKRDAKVYVPISSDLIGSKLGVDGDIVFGRLYYYLNRRYSFVDDRNNKTEFFALQVGNDKNAIQFPLLASVLAEMRGERKKYRIATTVSIVAAAIALTSLLIVNWEKIKNFF